jgi:MoxR-like ATPase
MSETPPAAHGPTSNRAGPNPSASPAQSAPPTGRLDIPAISKRIIANIEQVVVGKRQQIVRMLVAWYCEGHILLEDVPGVAKTILARAFAGSVGCSFNRIQCTPDLLPTDVTGGSIFNQKTSAFEFRPGPIFAQLVLVDEVNRATPRTQAALLEAMAESAVTIDGTTHPLKPPFLLVATQNPIDHEGTFPLPEAQLDRFLMKLSLGYPTAGEESQMLEMLRREHPLTRLKPVMTAEQLIACQRAVRMVHVDEKIRQYITQLVQATRAHEELSLGGSPRASIALYRTAQAVAAIRGRNYVDPDDVKHVVPSVLNHRMILRPESRLRKVCVAEILTEIMDATPVPLLER